MNCWIKVEMCIKCKQIFSLFGEVGITTYFFTFQQNSSTQMG